MVSVVGDYAFLFHIFNLSNQTIMKEPVKVLLVAINGYGHYYLKTLLEETSCEDAVLAGVVDPEAEKSKYFNALKEFCIPVCSGINDFYLGGGKADLAVIASPPHFHVSQSILALHHGTNVLCEKPISGQLSEAEILFEKSKKSKKFVMAGYQWSYSEGIRNLKKDIISARFGKPVRMKSLCLWPRNFAYFSRNKWAYMKTDPDGNIIEDNLFNNAMSHFIHNMLYLLGDAMDSSANASGVEAIVAKAYQVETYDTGAIHATTLEGVELLFLGSHATEKNIDPCFRIEFEKGFVELKPGADRIIARTTDRHDWSYPSPDSDHQFRKLFTAIENASGGGDLVCPVGAALSHARLVDEIGKDCGSANRFPEKSITRTKERLFVNGLDDLFLSCYTGFNMPGNLLSR